MEMNKRLDMILADIKERGYFTTIGRYKYNLDLADEIAIIQAIGKQRTPNFVIDDYCRPAYENIVKWCIGDNTAMCQDPTTKQFVPANMKKGWWIAGNTGSGKSWCLDIIKAYCSAMHFKVNFGDTEGQLYWANTRADEIIADYMADGTIRCRQNRIVGIHDVCTEAQESIYMGNRIPIIRNILEYRGDRTDMITFVTSNYPMAHNKITELYGERVASRLPEMFNYIEIKGIDRRTNKPL